MPRLASAQAAFPFARAGGAGAAPRGSRSDADRSCSRSRDGARLSLEADDADPTVTRVREEAPSGLLRLSFNCRVGPA